MSYSYHNQKWIQKKIQERINVLVKQILIDLPETKSIILAGGFGKGEGGIRIRPNKKIELINDFDVYIITNNVISEKRLNETANKVTKEYGYNAVDFKRFNRKKFSNMFYVDLKCIPLKKLNKLPPMLRYYDIRNNSKVIWGKDYRNLIPNYKVSDLPLGEGLRLLLNRATHLLQYFSIDFLDEINLKEKEWLEVFFSKAILDSAEAIEILREDLSPNIIVRNKKFQEKMRNESIIKNCPEFLKLLDKYTKFRITSKIRIKSHVQEWFLIKNVILKIIKNYVSEMTGKKIKNYEELSWILRKKIWKKYLRPYVSFKRRLIIKTSMFDDFLTFFGQYYLNFLYYVRIIQAYKKFNLNALIIPRSPDQRFFSSMILLLSCLKKEGIDEKTLKLAEKRLKEVYPVKKIKIKNPKKYWEKIKNEFCNAYLLYSFLKIG